MSTLYKKIAVEAALKSGAFIKRSVGKVKTLSYKGRINIVTDVDKKAEDIIVGKINAAFPGHSILAEEGSPKYGRSPFKWIVDPLDGTTNFAHGFPFFSVSIALEERGRIILGVIYDPIRDELFCAQKGKGAYLNGKRIKVSKEKSLRKSFLVTGFAYDIKEARDNNVRNFENFLMRAMAIRRVGSAALDFCYVACGRFDGYWELNLNPWDCAAGTLIVKEAGGTVTKLDGSAYSHYDREVLASNGLVHKQMAEVLKK
jgi:myo-inositol-1(or 4)-monophosphatase